MRCRRMILSRLKIILIVFLLLSGCDSNSSNDNNQSIGNNSEGIPEGSTNLSGVSLSGVLGDVFFVRPLFKGPGNPGPDGTVGPPDNAGEGAPEDIDPNSPIGEEGEVLLMGLPVELTEPQALLMEQIGAPDEESTLAQAEEETVWVIFLNILGGGFRRD